MEPSGLSTLHTDVVAVEVDVGERRVALQRFSKHLTAKATSLQQHSCIDRRSLPPILTTLNTDLVRSEVDFRKRRVGLQRFGDCLMSERNPLKHHPPSGTTRPYHPPHRRHRLRGGSG